MPSFSAKPAVVPRDVGFILFSRTKLLDFAGPLQVFNDARLPDGEKAYQVAIFSEDGGQIETDTGLALQTRSFETCRTRAPDTLIVSGGDAAIEAAQSMGLLAFLSEMAPQCRRLGSVCLGAFILAQGGHLNGRRATTHWEGSEQLQQQFPLIDVCDDSIFEEDGGIWTSAGVTAGMDMALAMIEQDLGRAEAMRIAQSFVLYIRRSGGQRQFSAALARQAQCKTSEFDSLLTRILAELPSDLSVPRLAAMANMSERTFARRFITVTGTSPARFVEDLRVHAACEALQRREVRLAEGPHLFGFGNAERMRRAFQRVVGLSPSEYQMRFGG